MKRFYINLSNGVEFLNDPVVRMNNINTIFMYLPSSLCEAKRFDLILERVSDDLLLHLALGVECYIFDASTKDRKPKALRVGVQWIKYVLSRVWFDKEITLEKGMHKAFAEYYKKLKRTTIKRIKYYKKYLHTDKINLHCIYSKTELDSKHGRIAEQIKEFVSYVSKKYKTI